MDVIKSSLEELINFDSKSSWPANTKMSNSVIFTDNLQKFVAVVAESYLQLIL